MNNHELISFYEKRKSDFSLLLTAKTTKINLISNLRLLAALAIFILIYFAFSNTLLVFVAVPLMVVFAVLVKWHSKLFVEKVHLENLVRINSVEVAAINGDTSSFINGMEFVDPHHPYTHDLDIFGDGSLFQHLNRCNTRDGKRTLADRLSYSLHTAGVIEQHQGAVRELAGKPGFRQDFQAAGMEIEELPGDRQELIAWLNVPAFLYGKPTLKILLFLVPAVTILCLIGLFFVDRLRPLVILLAIFQWGVFGFYAARINAFHEFISRKKLILEKYAHILHFLQGEKFNSPLMQSLSAQANEADKKVKALASLVSSLNARLNALTMLFVNSLLMYDLNCVYRLEKWKAENAPNLSRWLDAVCETEVVSSLGTFAFNHASFTFPEIHAKLTVEATALGHPLIPGGECVTNDFAIGREQSVLIVTGANMAGKSTFLRTIGVNLVLALSGAPVCARQFKCAVVPIRSGMRTADSLKDHQSYFYAELNRLKSIMDELKSGKPLFILLDEILKGTNSTDKQSGSIALVRQLLEYPCLAMIATHDLALGDLEKEFPLQLKNYCFEANIENDQLSFDYTLKAGLASKMNATFLMKKMGIIPS